MKVLAHYNADQTTPYGIWWVDPTSGLLKNVYVDEDSAQAARGRLIVFGKSNPDVSWSEYFDTLAARTPYVESWLVYDDMGMRPDQMLNALEEAPAP